MTFRRGEAPRRSDRPEPGFYLIRLVRGGPLVPAEIIQRRGQWGAAIDGAPPRSWNADPFRSEGVERVWLGERVTKAEHDRRVALKSVSGHPAQTPDRKIDLTAIPPIF